MRNAILAMGLLVTFCPSPSEAGKVRTIQLSGPTGFAAGDRRGLILTSEGTLRLAPQGVASKALPATQAWAVLPDQAEGCLVATGFDGKLLRVPTAGSSKVVHEDARQAFLSLARGPGGTVFLGTGGQGQILQLLPSGEVKLFCATDSQFVWCLHYDARHDELWAGTGPNGQLLCLRADGTVRQRVALGQEHVLSLAMNEAGTLFAGSSPRGLVHVVAPGSQPRVLCQTPQAEVRTLLCLGNLLYLGTSGVEPRRGAATEKAEKQSKENSVFACDEDGHLRELLSLKGVVHALAWRNGQLVVAAGSPGRLLLLDPQTKVHAVVPNVEASVVQSLATNAKGSLHWATSDPAQIGTLEANDAVEGTFVSEPLDAGRPARWGAVVVSMEPTESRTKVEIRQGNTHPPDGSWTDWKEAREPGAQVTGPARYVQVRLSMQAHSGPSEIRGLLVRHQQVNLPPEVTAIELPAEERPLAEAGKKLKLKWSATDPNDDELTYRLLCRKEGWRDWIELAGELEKKEWEVDPTTLPPGRYRFKVIASDHRENPRAEAGTGEHISPPLAVDAEAPTLKVRVVGLDLDRARVEAEAEDGHSRLASASFSVDGGPWQPVFPEEGFFDGLRCRFRFQTESLRPGTHVLVMRVSDAAGNSTQADFVFEVTRRSVP